MVFITRRRRWILSTNEHCRVKSLCIADLEDLNDGHVSAMFLIRQKSKNLIS